MYPLYICHITIRMLEGNQYHVPHNYTYVGRKPISCLVFSELREKNTTTTSRN